MEIMDLCSFGRCSDAIIICYVLLATINITRHSHRHSPRRAQGLIHVTTKEKVILALLCQKSYPLSRGQHALDDPNSMKEHTQIPFYEYV